MSIEGPRPWRRRACAWLFASALGGTLVLGATDGSHAAPIAPARSRPAPAESTSPPTPALAPWQGIPKAKRGYAVFRELAGTQWRDRLDHPVTDPTYIDFMAKRAGAFSSGKQKLPLVLAPSSIVDIGATSPTDSRTAALVDLDASPELQAKIAELGFDPSTSYINAVLLSGLTLDPKASRTHKRNVYTYDDAVIVTIAAKDHTRTTSWQLEPAGFRELSDVRGQTLSKKAAKQKVAEMAGNLPTLYHAGWERVALEAPPVRGKSFGEAEAAKLASHCARVGCEKVEAAQSQRLSASDAAGAKLVKVPLPPATSPTPPPAEAQTPGGSPPAGGGLPHAGFFSTAPSQGNKPVYGLFRCSNQCSWTKCVGCCAAWHAADNAIVFATSATCHALSDLCPWCHAGCAINTAIMSSAAATAFMTCNVVGCNYKYTPSTPVCGTY